MAIPKEVENEIKRKAFSNGYGKATFEKWRELEKHNIGKIIYSFNDIDGIVEAEFVYFEGMNDN